jgi:hypothetical protein
MDHNPHNHIAQAADALAARAAHTPQSLSADELIIALSDVATIAALLGELATQTRRQLADWATVGAQPATRRQLADWATVGAYLQQVEQYAWDLSRSAKDACATFAFNSSRRTVA